MQSVKLSLEQINSTSGFEPLFLHKVTFEEDFDIVLRLLFNYLILLLLYSQFSGYH